MFKTKNTKPKIAVFGYIVRGPIGGLAWHHLQYVLGFKKLGFDVLFLEDSEDYPACYNPQTNQLSTDATFGLNFIAESFKSLDLENQWSYHDAHKNKWIGSENAKEFLSQADILFNLSGVNPLRDWCLEIPVRVFVDTDPAFVQIRNLTDVAARKLAGQHNVFFTFGENIGATDCIIPDDGFDWKPTRQPIVLDAWKISEANNEAHWTTVMQWDSYKSAEFKNENYGMKSESFKNFFDLPRKTNQILELAVGSESAPRDFLTEQGWQITNPLIPTRTIWSYQDYIRNSKAEFSIAKEGYVKTKSGWFSERSAAYLASGRPVVTQNTNFSKFIETDKGLFSFSNPEEAVSRIDSVCRDYKFHCREARRIAEEYFDYRKILLGLLENSL